MKFSLLAACIVLWSWGPAAVAATIEDFYGDYVGHVVVDEYGKKVDRDLSVSIRPAAKEGRFFIKWTTVVHKADGRLKRKVYNIKFAPTRRPNIFSSAMKRNVFGGLVALDPLKGDPYVWARIKDDTLTVNALIIDDDGDYEMQVYNRTLNQAGLKLDYQRQGLGDLVKQISTQLVRVAD